jgi:hypothetical protein
MREYFRLWQEGLNESIKENKPHNTTVHNDVGLTPFQFVVFRVTWVVIV